MASKKDWKRIIWRKSNGMCAHCGKIPSKNHMTVDHVIPKAMGGGNDSRNLMPLCEKCNKDKASGVIDPLTYYRYADEHAKEDMIKYIDEWNELYNA